VSAITLRKLLSHCGGDWARLVAFTQLAINNKLSDLGTTPFELMFNRKLNPFASYVHLPELGQDTTAWIDHQRKVHTQLFPALAKAIYRRQMAMQAAHDRAHPLSPPLEPGTTVMVRDPIRSDKNQPPYLGPYTVVSRASTSTYHLRDDTGALFHRAVPVDQLKVLHTASEPIVTDAVQSDGLKLVPDTVSSAPAAVDATLPARNAVVAGLGN
jgi:hypothetical protein